MAKAKAKKKLNFKFSIATVMHFYLLIMGVSSTRYDLQNSRIIKSRVATLFANFMAAILILSVPIVSLISLTFMNEYANNWVMRLTVQVNSAIRFVVVLLTVIGRWKREKRFNYLARLFYKIDSNYFCKLKELNLDAFWERRFDCCFILKFVTMCLQPVTMIFGMYQLTRESLWRNFFMSLYFGNLNFVISAVLFQYYISMWHACKRFMILNRELRLLVVRMQLLQDNARKLLPAHSSTLNELGRLAAEDLNVIAKVHDQLTTLMLSLNDCFRTQMLGVLMTYLIYNIMFGYYTWVVITGAIELTVSLTLWSSIFGVLLYSSLFVDLYMLYWACEATTCSQLGPKSILMDLNVFPTVPMEFARECESFSWQITARKFAIGVAGMFNLNRHTALCFWAYIMQQTVVLIQFDYENRLKRKHGK